MRKPYGPGWALVGDAGFNKDPILAHGISDAFRDAELLANAVNAGLTDQTSLDEALSTYEEQRNDAVLPGYEQNCAVASFVPPPPEFMAERAAAHTAQQSAPEPFRNYSIRVPRQAACRPHEVEEPCSAAA